MMFNFQNFEVTCLALEKTDVPLFGKQHPAQVEGSPNQPCLVSKPQHHDFQTGAFRNVEERKTKQKQCRKCS